MSIGPNWFAAVMGTGIVATAAELLPVELPGRHELAVVFWLLAVVLLLVLGAATAATGCATRAGRAATSPTRRWRPSTARRRWRC